MNITFEDTVGKKKDEIVNNDAHSDLIQRILNQRESLPKKQKQLSDYIIENYQSVGVLTVSELAHAANVGTTTVMRLIKNLGYQSYSDIKNDIHTASIESTPAAWWHLQKSFEDTDHEEHTLTRIWQEVGSLLNQTLTDSLTANFDLAIKLILKADRVNVLGMRSSKGLAIYFGLLLEEFYPKVNQLSYDTEFIYDRASRFTKNDILLLIDNAPFTTVGIDTAQFCHENNVPVILITDHFSSPAASYASVTLKTESSEKQYSVVPTVYLLESLVIGIGRETAETSISNLDYLSQILKKKNITS